MNAQQHSPSRSLRGRLAVLRLITMAVSMAAMTVSHAEIYTWTDKNGIKHFSNHQKGKRAVKRSTPSGGGGDIWKRVDRDGTTHYSNRPMGKGAVILY